MRVNIPAGKYVIAVSGGVDSMVLLHLLRDRADLDLVVAHFNHGIRADAVNDEQLVSRITKAYGKTLEVGYGHLEGQASEEEARDARYRFLRDVMQKHKAKAIMTAHHQDDLIETAIINMIRGTGRRGLTAISQNKTVLRPLLGYPKRQIEQYAKNNKIEWRNDSTNNKTEYLRNYIRKAVASKLAVEDRKMLISNIDKVAKEQGELDGIIATLSRSHIKENKIDRAAFAQLPAGISHELMMYWLRNQGVYEFDRKTVNRLSTALKTSLPNSRHNVQRGLWLVVERDKARFTTTV